MRDASQPDEASEPRPGAVGRIARGAVSTAWAINPLMLVAAIAWLYFDGRSRRAIESVSSLARWLWRSDERIAATAFGADTALALAVGCVFFTLLLMLGGLFVGPRGYRTTRRWALLIVVVAGWLTVLTTWPGIHWRGQSRRVAIELTPLESVVRGLRSDWPAADGEIEGLGVFLAYPKGHPTTLLFLGEARPNASRLQIASVERRPNGAILFELEGPESGAWVEWRPQNDAPGSFSGGLGTNYRLKRYERLAPCWFIVRYGLTGRL